MHINTVHTLMQIQNTTKASGGHFIAQQRIRIDTLSLNQLEERIKELLNSTLHYSTLHYSTLRVMGLI